MSKSAEDRSSDAHHLEVLNMPHATFDDPDLTTFARLDELGRVGVAQIIP